MREPIGVSSWMPQGCHNSQTTGQAADLDHDDTALRPAPRKTSHALLSRCGALRVHLQHVNRLARRHACASAARRVTSYSDEPDRLTFAQQQRPSLAVTFMHSSPSSCHAVPPATKQGRQIRHRNCESQYLVVLALQEAFTCMSLQRRSEPRLPAPRPAQTRCLDVCFGVQN